jgi:hypothetical protein
MTAAHRDTITDMVWLQDTAEVVVIAARQRSTMWHANPPCAAAPNILPFTGHELVTQIGLGRPRTRCSGSAVVHMAELALSKPTSRTGSLLACKDRMNEHAPCLGCAGVRNWARRTGRTVLELPDGHHALLLPKAGAGPRTPGLRTLFAVRRFRLRAGMDPAVLAVLADRLDSTRSIGLTQTPHSRPRCCDPVVDRTPPGRGAGCSGGVRTVASATAQQTVP